QIVQIEGLETLPDGLGAHAAIKSVGAVFLLCLDELVLGHDLAELHRGILGVADDEGLEIEHLLQVLEGDVKQVADPRRERLKEPDVGHRRGQVDVAKPLAAHLGRDYLNSAFLADYPTVLHALVLAAIALVILGGSEYFGAEQTVPLRLEGSVVDRLRLLYLAVGTLPDLV